MATGNHAVEAILSEIHGLLHEAKSNVELDTARGQTLIERIAAAESAQKAGVLPPGDLTAIVREVGEAIKPSIEKELSIDNPEAAVIQIRGLLEKLQSFS